MLTEQIARHDELRRAIVRLTSGAPSTVTNEPADVVVTPNEMNDKHGTGVLVKRVFAGSPGIVSVRARNDYGGDHDFGETALVLPQKGLSRADGYRQVLQAFEGRAVRRVACIPFVSDDLLTSIALHDAFGAPLAMWIMDDQNITADAIPDPLMREALEKCSLRLTTHPEMREAYEKKYGLPFSLLPAVVPSAQVTTTIATPPLEAPGAIVGSIWAREWFERLCATLARSGREVDWFGNDKSPYLRITTEELAAAGIRARGIVPETELAAALRERAFAICPTGVPDDTGIARSLAGLSLPGRILFIAATSNTPLIVLGSERTSAARFVRRFDIGVCCAYEPQAFRRAVDEVTSPDVQARMRRNAARIAPALSDRGVGAWFWGSLERGAPLDDRFEALLPRAEGEVGSVGQPAPQRATREA